MTREAFRNAASTLAHHYAHGDAMNRIGVERLLLAYPEAHQRYLSLLISEYLISRGHDIAAEAFESMLYDAAVCP